MNSLQSGVWVIHWTTRSYKSKSHQCRLYNIPIVYGTSEYGYNKTHVSTLNTLINISTAKTYRLEQQMERSDGNGLGLAVDFLETMKYTVFR